MSQALGLCYRAVKNLCSGRERTYAFLTLRATPADFAKCMNTMQGAMWRGGKLKIGEAKLRWDVRWALDLSDDRLPVLMVGW